ncbi:hypothetical protein SY88_11035 [Clostridiales bacterium PH28_bin88]|nr:hypothetical protein SY88_11035 [Clostridiales bacterium PH28_bin88]
MRWLFWPAFAAILWLAAYYMVPRENIRRFWTLGLIGGAGLTLLIQVIAVPLLGLWRFINPFFSIAGIPLFLPVAYIAEVLIFAQYLPPGTGERALYVVGFGGLNMAVEWFFLRYGLMAHPDWNLLYTFFLGIVAHLAVVYLYTLLVSREAKTV